MKTSRSYVLLALLLMPLLAHSAVLTRGTLIPVRLTQNVNGNINQVGETVYFQVLEDIRVNEEIVIRKGTFVNGKVNDAVGRKSMGKAGKLTLVPRSLKTESDKTVRFVQDPLSAEGRKRTGATVAHVIVWGPLGLFAKGRAAFIFLDTEYDIEVDDDIDLPPLEPLLETQAGPETTANSYNVEFDAYRKKINYRKVKIQKDFVLNIQSTGDSEISFEQNPVRVTRVLGYDLPQSIEPVAVKYNSKKEGYEVSFSFSDMIKYIAPGASKVTVLIGNDNPEVYTTTLNTDWKLK